MYNAKKGDGKTCQQFVAERQKIMAESGRGSAGHHKGTLWRKTFGNRWEGSFWVTSGGIEPVRLPGKEPGALPLSYEVWQY